MRASEPALADGADLARRGGARGVREPCALELRWLGRCVYSDALALQRELQEARIAGRIPDTVLLLEHPDVITLGRSTRPGSLRTSEAELQAGGYELHRVNRGGDATYHGPGQLVGYPILDLRARAAARGAQPDVHAYLRALEAALIDAIAPFGLAGHARAGRSGVWLDARRKIASLGIGLRRWVTVHGFALNVACDLERFAAIVPCGLEDAEMVSMESALGAPVSLGEVREQVERALREQLA